VYQTIGFQPSLVFVVCADIRNVIAICTLLQSPSDCLALIYRQMNVVLYVMLFSFFECGMFFKIPLHRDIIKV